MLITWTVRRCLSSPRSPPSVARSPLPRSVFFRSMSKHERPETPTDPLKHPSTKRAKQIDTEENPYEELDELQGRDGQPDPKITSVLHWFRHGDIRISDNRGLHMASAKAQEGGVPLLACYLFSPHDLAWHGVSAARADFLRESLVDLQKQLKERHIPLVTLTSETRAKDASTIVKFIKDHHVSHVFANYEYEVDELRRDIGMHEELTGKHDVAFELHHDQVIMDPRRLTGSSGGPLKVFTPYHKAWLAEVAAEPSLLDTVDAPKANDKAVADQHKELFASKIPNIPEKLHFKTDEHLKKIRKLWPAGHAAGSERLQHFLKKKVSKYAAQRSNPAKDMSSRLSPYFNLGVLSMREAVSAAKDANDGSVHFNDNSDPGIAAWVREIVFREFYRHMMTLFPHTGMNLPKNLKFDFVEWEDDEEGWKKWCNGTTGMPFIDAGMRQLAAEAYMHNRLRMNTASYLRTNLLIDYRRGERYFAENLVDWDLCNNTNGWEPSWTVFNPVSQAERNDPDGEYIRKWVPELREVEGKAVFDPYNRLDKKAFEKLGYPKPHVDWAESKERCMQRYKHDMQDAEP